MMNFLTESKINHGLYANRRILVYASPTMFNVSCMPNRPFTIHFEVKVGKFIWKRACLSAFMFKIYMKAQKHACFYVFSSFSASFYPHYIIMVKGLFPDLCQE